VRSPMKATSYSDRKRPLSPMNPTGSDRSEATQFPYA
jgi:hypothetical protein